MTTTTLKEEVKDILGYYGAEVATDQILKLVEKRIIEYRDNEDNYCHDCAKMNINDILEMLK
jgi:hypothetical protein